MRGYYQVITYGCQMNVHESEKLAGILQNRGYMQASDDDIADVVVLNTCCVRETAETHVLGNLGALKKRKELKPTMIIAVCGCMTQADGAAERLKKRCPFIDIIFGTHNLAVFDEYLLRAERHEKVIEIWKSEAPIREDVPVSRSSGVNAWVNIMYGCNNFCSYCIVPYVRGRERSRSAERILADVEQLVGEGYKEITLLGQNVNSYGNDLAGAHLDFAGLLHEISQISGKFRIKFMTSHPKDLSENVVKTIAMSDKIAHFIHLPVQAGSNRILQLMNRKYTAESYLQRIKMIKSMLPDVGLSGDIMVGFPTETEEDFCDTLSLVRQVQYQNLYTFIYSKRSGTPAAQMEQVETAIKKDRIKRLISTQFEIANSLAAATVGKTYEVLCHEWKDGTLIAKTACDKTVKIKSLTDLTGSFVKVKIAKNRNSKLYGEIIQ